jgi:hypothetical protein
MSTVPQELNWVKARSECSVGRVFSQLFIEAEQDIKEINLLPNTPGYPPPTFAMRRNTAGNCFVVFEAGNTNAVVDFQLVNDHIVIAMPNGKRLTITLTLNNDGVCKLKVNGEGELERWQVRRMVLESLFFDRFR